MRPALTASSSFISAGENVAALLNTLRSGADHDVPAPHPPICNESFGNVRIGLREPRCHGCVVALENQSSAVDGIRKGSGHEQFASAVRLFQELQMLWSKRHTPTDEIVNDFVKKNEIHTNSCDGEENGVFARFCATLIRLVNSIKPNLSASR
jgi:hypothetical protein